jgi:YhcH/YjgK/YiaL family protein
MILDSLLNAGLYESIHPRFKQAFDFLLNTDLMALPLGKIELDGKNLFANVVSTTCKTAETARLETHNHYIDIQVPVTAAETMGWIAGNKLKNVTDSYNSEKDITFFADKATNFINVLPSEFVVFFPEDGHQPEISDNQHKKIIVKVML